MQVGLYSNVASPGNTTPQERRIVGMAGIAQAAIAQKPAAAAMALKFLKAYQADPGCSPPHLAQLSFPCEVIPLCTHASLALLQALQLRIMPACNAQHA